MIRKCWTKRFVRSKAGGCMLALASGACLTQTTCLPATNGGLLGPFDLSLSELLVLILPLAESLLRL